MRGLLRHHTRSNIIILQAVYESTALYKLQQQPSTINTTLHPRGYKQETVEHILIFLCPSIPRGSAKEPLQLSASIQPSATKAEAS